MKDLYKILDVKKNASQKQIKQAYYKLANIYHPDKNNGNEVQEFLDINLAYTILSNKEKRNEYNKTGKYDINVANTYARAVQSLIELFIMIIKDKGFIYEKQDLFNLMKSIIIKEIEGKNSKIEELNKEIERLKNINKRISGKDTLFGDTTNNLIKENIFIIDNIDYELKVHNESLNIIKDYDYNEDKKEIFMQYILKTEPTTGTTI